MSKTHLWGIACVVVALVLSGCGESVATPAPNSANPTVAATTAPAPVATTATLPTAAPTVALAVQPTSIVTPGDNWPALESRPLTLPSLAPGAACPVTTTPNTIIDPNVGRAIGQGPVYAIGLNRGNFIYNPYPTYGNSAVGWGGSKILWVSDSAYHGPVLVRGRQLDGPNEVRFDHSAVSKELRFDGEPQRGPMDDPTYQWRERPSETLVRAPGCYAYQVDGLTFSYSIVFRATPLAS